MKSIQFSTQIYIFNFFNQESVDVTDDLCIMGNIRVNMTRYKFAYLFINFFA